ncbi:MAG: D-2-hydroxyacid dehydrogenase [Muribaculaceae bacterium]|nr:D-2-hydroxyacid dehydrogenase [Muribaculaceae bacterium]
MKHKIVVLDGFVANSGDLSWEALERLGELTVYDRTAPEEIAGRCADADIVITNKVVLDADTIGRLPMLRYVGVLATGYNNVDLAACRDRGITVCNIPAYSTESVVQTALALLLELTNRAGTYARSVSEGAWTRCNDFSYRLGAITELCGKTAAVYGLGNIGMRMAEVLHSLGMKIIAFTSKTAEQLPAWIEKTDKDDFFRRADVLTLHAPLTDSNAGFICDTTLALMRPSALLVNTARGGLVDEQALAAALREGRIVGAGLDVLRQEPPAADCPLLDAPNCVITPHVAWQSTEARRRLLEICAGNVEAFIKGSPVNVIV